MNAILQNSRREFLATGARLGAATMVAPAILRSANAGLTTLNVGIVGCGTQGRVLLNAALNIPGIRFRAVCDIWPYNRTYAERLLAKFGHDARPFEDFREMLSAVVELDAVIVATPDFMHAEHTNACLRAGKHVYCEKLMANTVENARSMVRTQRETGKLLQIGHQRRSNPRYRHALDRVVRHNRLLGRLTNCTAQWDRAVSDDLGWPERHALPESVLNRYGYASMHEFCNWRWFKKYAGGPIADLGAHQIDVFNWFLGVNPTSVMAGGGVDYYTTHEWFDNVFAIYEFDTPTGRVRGLYQVLTTTSAGGGYHEYFMGDEGALKMSENPQYTKVYREARAPEWDHWVDQGVVNRSGAGDSVGATPIRLGTKESESAVATSVPRAYLVDVRETAALAAWDLPVVLDKAIHQPHLENFFDSVQGKAKLHCPAEVAFASTVTVLRVNEAISARQTLTFRPEDFIA